MRLDKISQEVRYKFNHHDDSPFIKAVINVGNTNCIKFEAKNIWLNNLTSLDILMLKADLRDLAEFLTQLSEELPE